MKGKIQDSGIQASVPGSGRTKIPYTKPGLTRFGIVSELTAGLSTARHAENTGNDQENNCKDRAGNLVDCSNFP